MKSLYNHSFQGKPKASPKRDVKNKPLASPNELRAAYKKYKEVVKIRNYNYKISTSPISFDNFVKIYKDFNINMEVLEKKNLQLLEIFA